MVVLARNAILVRIKVLVAIIYIANGRAVQYSAVHSTEVELPPVLLHE